MQQIGMIGTDKKERENLQHHRTHNTAETDLDAELHVHNYTDNRAVHFQPSTLDPNLEIISRQVISSNKDKQTRLSYS